MKWYGNYLFSFRLLQILETSKCSLYRGREEPFRTYEALNQAACDLANDLKLTREALAGAARQQGYTVARLHGDYDALHGATYTELQQLVLEPQVRPMADKDQELWPNAQVCIILYLLLVIIVNSTRVHLKCTT